MTGLVDGGLPTLQLLLAVSGPDAAPLWSAETLLRSLLIGWLFWLGIALGSQALVWLQELTGGAWGRAIRVDAEAAGRTLPLLLLGLVPILFNLPTLYAWARPDAVASDPVLARKALWLNPTGFVIRSVLYAAAWIVMSGWVRHVRKVAERNPSEEHERTVRARSAMALVVYGLTMTFASIDWAMSLEPHWYSGIYGVIFIIGQVLSGFAFTTALETLGPFKSPATSRPATAVVPAAFPLRDLGNLLLAFTMLWTYVAFSQFLIIWFGDLPEEVVWYTRRNARGWEWLAVLLLLLHFVVPFLLLLSSDVKRRGRVLGTIALGLLVMRWFDLVWNIEPAFGPSRLEPLLIHGGIALALGLVWWPLFRSKRRQVASEWSLPSPPAPLEVPHG